MVKDVEKKDKKIFLVAQEIELAKLLAGNNKNVRDKALRNLKKWFYNRSRAVPFNDEDFQRIWKGLFYSMWMSDKPLTQEECAENISNLVHFPTYDLSIQFFKAGLTILTNEWFGIDQLRLDKFLMFLRRFLRHMLMVLKDHGFNKENIGKFNEVISNTVFKTTGKVPLGLVMHFIEIFMEELAKVTEGRIHPDSVTEILRPFIRKLATTDDGRQAGHIRKYVFTYLIRQSDMGLEYQAKYEAWKQLGFPGSINSMQKIKLDENEQMPSDEDDTSNDQLKERPLDPRAGRVDVELPQIKFSSKKLAEILMNYKFDKNSTKRGRNMISVLSKQFAMMANGKYPLGITKIETKAKNDPDINIRKAATRLIKFEQKILGKNANKRKRHNSNEQNEELEQNVNIKRQKVINDNKNLRNNTQKSAEKKKSKEILDSVKNKQTKKHKKKERKFETIVENTINNQDMQDSSMLPVKNESNNIENNLKKKSKKVLVDNTKQLGKLKQIENKRKRNRNQKNVINNIECVFKRNSGTWVVFDVSKEPEESLVPNQIGHFEDAVDTIHAKHFIRSDDYSGQIEHGTDFEIVDQSNSNKVETLKQESVDNSFDKIWNNGSPNKLISSEKLKKPIKLLESPPRGRALFPRTKWDEALQEGEYEVFVPSKKYLKKMQKLVKKNSQTDSQVLVSPSQNNQVKSRRSLDPSIIKNPFSIQSNSAKKVKINTKLNRSQEIYEHHMQILSSPGIPHDPNKKPIKPVLKSPARTNSINPFYDKQLSVW